MPKFGATVNVVVTYDVEVEADSEQEAYAKLESMSAPDVDEQGQYLDTEVVVTDIGQTEED